MCSFFPVQICGNSVRRLPNHDVKKFTIQIQGYSPTQEDDYVGVALKAEPGYVVEFEPAAHADRVHHMILYGCTEPAYTDRNFWQNAATCSSGNHILYAWARNAPSLKLPENVAFAIGNEGDPVQYLVLQIHYAKKFTGNVRDFSGITLHLSPQKPRFLAGVYLMISGDTIMPGSPAYYTNMSCSYQDNTRLYPFAFRTHTHQFGRVVSAYVKKGKSGEWLQIGKRNPQWPQLFQLRQSELVIESGDFIAGTCRYDSHDQTQPIPMGAMGKNEMCNFYMMYYQEASEPDPFPYGAGCFGDQEPDLVAREYPKEGTTLLPPHPEWEHQAHQSAKPFGVLEQQKVQELGGEKLGQVAGLAVDQDGRLVVFHRAGRVWDQNTFDANNELLDRRPIERAVILVAENGKQDGKLQLVAKYGENKFFLPHGIFVDLDGAVFTTDVGSHQVIKWSINGGKLEPVFALGEKFMPGSDQSHFCKPAGVAVSKLDGTIFVADGYCNNRVVKFTKSGKFLSQFGQSVSNNFNAAPTLPLGEFTLPHDITLDEHGDRVFVADREDGRVQAFALSTGKALYEVRNQAVFPTVYSVHYQPDFGLMFVPGTSAYTRSGQAQQIEVYVVQPNQRTVQYAFRPQSDFLRRPHVLRAVGPRVWIGEIAESGGVLWQLEIQSDSAGGGANGNPHQKPQHAEHQMANGNAHVAGGNMQSRVMGPGMAGAGGDSVTDNSLFHHPIGGPLLPSSPSDFALGSALVMLLVICSACCLLYLLIWRCCCAGDSRKNGHGHDSFDKKGFKPLHTSDPMADEEDEEDADGADELSSNTSGEEDSDGDQAENGKSGAKGGARSKKSRNRESGF